MLTWFLGNVNIMVILFINHFWRDLNAAFCRTWFSTKFYSRTGYVVVMLFQWRAGKRHAHAVHSNTHTDRMIDIPTLQEISRKFHHVASTPVVGGVVGHLFLGLTPLPCVFNVKVVSRCNKKTGKHCFHVFYTHIIYLCSFHQGCSRLLLCS